MRLPEWCQTHSFKEFLQLIEEDDNLRTLSPNKGKIMENDINTAPTVELVSSEVSGYLGADGQFVYGAPVETFVQTDEDVIETD